MRNKKLGNKGFGAYELLTISMICLILTFIVLEIALNTQKGEKYTIFAYNAKVLGTNAVEAQMFDSNLDVMYLKDMIDEGFITPIKNPFEGNGFCDVIESKVIFDGEERRIDLRCGNMVIQNHILGDDKVVIYEVSDWKEKKSSKKDVEKVFYNYENDGKNGLDEYVEESLFLKTVNQKNGKKYKSIEEAEKELKIKTKTMYRTEKVVKTVKY